MSKSQFNKLIKKGMHNAFNGIPFVVCRLCQQLDHAKNLVIESHNKVMEMIDAFSNDDLFSKGALIWTGASTLGSYCVSATSSHYDWAIKKIKLHKKTQA